MTKFITTLTRRGCNVCDSPNITWSDCEDMNHLCAEHRINDKDYKCGRNIDRHE